MKKFGCYTGRPYLEPLEPPIKVAWWEAVFPRRPTLLVVKGFEYRPSSMETWVVREGVVVNGVSSPRFFWRFLPPFGWRSIRASIVHDAYCVSKDRPSADVHRMFYKALRCDGVCVLRASLMWFAVRVFGPRF